MKCIGWPSREDSVRPISRWPGVTPRLHDAAWEPVWTAFEETGLILSFHVVVFLGGSQNSAPAPEEGKPASVFANTKLFMGQFLDPFVDLFAWGILERHPRLKLVMAESGLGWLPWIVQELDYRHWRLWEAKEYCEHCGVKPLGEPAVDWGEQVIGCSPLALLP
jgi:uncharacterized protein